MKDEPQGVSQAAQPAIDAAKARRPNDVIVGAASVAEVSAAGSVAGLSAAEITSEVAEVSVTVRGGMVAGAAITAAAAAVVGYGAYRLWKWLSE